MSAPSSKQPSASPAMASVVTASGAVPKISGGISGFKLPLMMSVRLMMRRGSSTTMSATMTPIMTAFLTFAFFAASAASGALSVFSDAASGAASKTSASGAASAVSKASAGVSPAANSVVSSAMGLLSILLLLSPRRTAGSACFCAGGTFLCKCRMRSRRRPPSRERRRKRVFRKYLMKIHYFHRRLQYNTPPPVLSSLFEKNLAPTRRIFSPYWNILHFVKEFYKFSS